MYISEVLDKRVNKKYLFLKESYRNEKGIPAVRIIKNYGQITETNKAELLKQAEKDKTDFNDTKEWININKPICENKYAGKDLNIGFVIIENIYNTLNIEDFIKNNIKKRAGSFDLNSTIKLMVYSRILNPDSKFETFRGKESFFDNPFEDVKLDNVYDSLTDLFKVEKDLQLHIHQEVSKLYNRDMEIVFYDVTNYFFETDYDDGLDNDGNQKGLRYVGVSKENRETPIVQMGLLMDKDHIPIAYKLFPGNTHDSKTIISVLEDFKTTFSLKSITVIADKGLNSGANIDYFLENNYNFIVSQMVRGRDEKLRNKVLEKDGYKWTTPDVYKIKDFAWERKYCDMKNEKITKVQKFRVIAYWSKKFADREKHKRGDLEKKLKEFEANPAKFNASNAHGSKKYLKVKIVDKKTKKINKDCKNNVTIDWVKYKRDVEMDGYYSIITNDWNSTPEEIVQRYKGLAKIEETFRVTKTDLQGRPVYVWTQEHIHGHFLTCFIALIIVRLLQKKLDWKYSAERIQKALNSASAREVTGKTYSLSQQNDDFLNISKLLSLELNFDFQKYEVLKRNLRKFAKEKIFSYLQKK